jgi:hypothetical protein
MSKALNFIFIIFIFQLSFSQEEIKTNPNFSLSLLTRNFEYLNHGNELFEKFPILKKRELYCIVGCIYLLEMNELEIKKIAIARLKGISTQLFNEGKPVILTYGMNSINIADKENENLEDDNHVIYLSIADCIVRNSEEIARSEFNNQTRLLIAKKNGG